MALPAPKKSHVPKFNAGHLNPHQARKLKKQWLEVQKIKAAYRAQKRRMGLGRTQTPPDSGKAGGGAEAEDLSGGDATDGEPPVRSDGALVEAITDARNDDEHAVQKPSKKLESGAKTAKTHDPSLSLREMAREAYSPASLHTYKSHPLRRQTHGKYNTWGQTNSASHHARVNRKQTTPGNRPGRGQPNMAKRMNVLLEKIKQTNQ